MSTPTLNTLGISNFKRIVETSVPLTPITVLVGGNNSGKSCVLQAAHLGIALLQSEAEVGVDTFTPERARYLPTRDFWDISHGERLMEGSAPVSVSFTFVEEEAGEQTFTVEARRGAGEAITLSVSEQEATARLLSDVTRPYSIYVPGLAGISLKEEYRVDAALIRGIASGDANLFLRNVLLRISETPDKKDRLDRLLDGLLPDARLDVRFNPKLDQIIDARIQIGEISRSIESFGTGVLQVLQILAYVINFEPALLLLDEPDAHLHPNNQRVIADTLRQIAAEGATRILIATHSRTLLDTLETAEEASFVWIENGEVQAEQKKDRLTMLMDLGALDGAEQFYSTTCTGIVLTEDTHADYLKALLRANGAAEGQILVHSYETSSKLPAATMLAGFIHDLKPASRVVIHRDRDFMQDDEIEMLKGRFKRADDDYSLFFTRLSDVEHYFVQPGHLSAVTGRPERDFEAIIAQIVADDPIAHYDKFKSKREEIKQHLYGGNRDACPSTLKLLDNNKLRFEQLLGKSLLKLMLPILAREGIRKEDILKPSDALIDTDLSTLIAGLPNQVEATGEIASALAPRAKRGGHG